MIKNLIAALLFANLILFGYFFATNRIGKAICILLVMLIIVILEYLKDKKKADAEKKIDDWLKPVFEPDNHMEFFDEGYLSGLKDFLNWKYAVAYTSSYSEAIEIFKEKFLLPVNQLTKVVDHGKFIIAPPDAENREHRIVFLTRSI